MKNIYIIQNSNLSFDMDIEKIYSPNKYFLLLIVNPFSFKKLNTRRQENLFQKIWVIDDFNFDYLKELITHHQHNNPLPLQIITNAEEAITLCGQLRVFFNNETLNFDRFKNKLVMKEMLNKEKILTPNHILLDKQLYQNQPPVYVNHILEKLDFPFLVKPIDSMGCIGIERISSVKELINWCNAAILTQNQYEIDEFISGKVYNCDSFI
ncbi:MAG: hypothetical protein JO149_02265, partial [Gammaproteobacteria bacterium]|nr:hypothetical protein [Gammaproteobacteria bacterium]